MRPRSLRGRRGRGATGATSPVPVAAGSAYQGGPTGWLRIPAAPERERARTGPGIPGRRPEGVATVPDAARAAMTQATGAAVPRTAGPAAQRPRPRPGRARPRRPHLTLNDDGQRHPMMNSLSLFTLVAGLVACVLGFLANQHGAGAWAHVGATWLGLITLARGAARAAAVGDPVGADADRDRPGGRVRRRLAWAWRTAACCPDPAGLSRARTGRARCSARRAAPPERSPARRAPAAHAPQRKPLTPLVSWAW